MGEGSAEHAAGGSEPPATRWEPEHYLRFADQRTRPVTDLIAQIRVPAPRLSVLGNLW